ncbi:hypothetical protein D9M73_217020 [compost metagenome]
MHVHAIDRCRAAAPAPGADIRVGFDDAARRRQHQAEGQVRGGGDHRTGRVANNNAPRRAGLDIDVVVTGTDGADQLQFRAGRQHRAVDLSVERRDQGVVRVLEQLGQVGRRIHVRHAHSAHGTQAFEQRWRKLAGNADAEVVSHCALLMCDSWHRYGRACAATPARRSRRPGRWSAHSPHGRRLR